MTTYRILNSRGGIVATGIPSWASAARLADYHTARSHDLHTIEPERS